MKYKNVVSGTFLSRPNRFIALVEANGKTQTVHVKNTGRLSELLVTGAKVFLCESENPNRKTKYDLIAVMKNGQCVNIDSYAPNIAVGEWLKVSGIFSESAVIKAEKVFGDSRFDFYVEDGSRKVFLEVKGVTLERNGTALFPDAPTLRGIKHINELAECVKQGYEAFILFVIQMKGVKQFSPNDATHKAFGDALRAAKRAGVKILAVDCLVTKKTMIIDKPIGLKTEATV